jgi:hypothetical protein
VTNELVSGCGDGLAVIAAAEYRTALGAWVAHISSMMPEQVKQSSRLIFLFESHFWAHEVSPAELHSFLNKHFADS